MLSIGKETVTRARRQGPGVPCRSSQAFGRLGAGSGSSSSIASTVARAFACSSAVSPRTFTNVPQDCSPASTSAARSGASGVSSR